MPRLTGGPFRYQRRADDYLAPALRYATVPVKQAVISPSALSLMYPRPEIAGYPREQFIDDLLSEHETEVRAACDQGAYKVQIDFTEGRLAIKIDPVGHLLHSFIDLNNLALARFSTGPAAHRRSHLSRRRPRFDPQRRRRLRRTAAQPVRAEGRHFYVALAGEPDRVRVLKIIRDHLKPHQRVFVGVVAPIDPRIETPEEVRDRVLEAAEFIPLEQLGTTDDCGFSPFCDDTVDQPRHRIRQDPRAGAGHGPRRRRARRPPVTPPARRGSAAPLGRAAERQGHPRARGSGPNRRWSGQPGARSKTAQLAQSLAMLHATLRIHDRRQSGHRRRRAASPASTRVRRRCWHRPRTQAEAARIRPWSTSSPLGSPTPQDSSSASARSTRRRRPRATTCSNSPMAGSSSGFHGPSWSTTGTSAGCWCSATSPSDCAADRGPGAAGGDRRVVRRTSSSASRSTAPSSRGIARPSACSATRAEEAIGQRITLIIPPDREDEEHAIMDRLRRGERVEHFETVRQARTDGWSISSVTISPVRDADGGPIGASKVARDITRAQADRGGAADRGPPEGRVPRRPRPRAAQSAGAVAQRPAGHPAGQGRRGSRDAGPLDDGAAARAHGAAGGRPAGRLAHQPEPDGVAPVAAPAGRHCEQRRRDGPPAHRGGGAHA